MRVRSAANAGLGLVIVHLSMSIGLGVFSVANLIAAMGPTPPLKYMATTMLHIVTTVILDVALLIVFGSLARTDEQFLRDGPEH